MSHFTTIKTQIKDVEALRVSRAVSRPPRGIHEGGEPACPFLNFQRPAPTGEERMFPRDLLHRSGSGSSSGTNLDGNNLI